jgi:hypothetical protein
MSKTKGAKDKKTRYNAKSAFYAETKQEQLDNSCDCEAQIQDKPKAIKHSLKEISSAIRPLLAMISKKDYKKISKPITIYHDGTLFVQYDADPLVMLMHHNEIKKEQEHHEKLKEAVDALGDRNDSTLMSKLFPPVADDYFKASLNYGYVEEDSTAKGRKRFVDKNGKVYRKQTLKEIANAFNRQYGGIRRNGHLEVTPVTVTDLKSWKHRSKQQKGDIKNI